MLERRPRRSSRELGGRAIGRTLGLAVAAGERAAVSCTLPISRISASRYSLRAPAPQTGQITDAIAGPDGLYVDPSGTLYVCNFGAGTVTEYPKGQTTHSKTLTGTIGPKYVVAGRDGTVYVSDFGNGSHSNLYEYADGSTTPTTTITFATFPAGVALDTTTKFTWHTTIPPTPISRC